MNELRLYNFNGDLNNIIYTDESPNDLKFYDDNNEELRVEIRAVDIITNNVFFHEDLKYLNIRTLLNDIDASNIPVTLMSKIIDESINNRYYRSLILNIIEASLICDKDNIDLINNYNKFFGMYINAMVLTINKNMNNIMKDAIELGNKFSTKANIKTNFIWD